MRSFGKFLIVFLMLSVPSLTWAANVYIKEGGSGAGTSWSDALDDLPATLVRGNTYYFADGSYAGYNFNDAEVGTQVITIKKCGTGDGICENATGYSAADHDGYAEFSSVGLHFENGYYVLDGNAADWSYGFRMAMGSAYGCWIDGANNLQIKSLWIYHTVSNHVRGLAVTAAGTNNTLIQNVRITRAGNDAFLLYNSSNVTYDHVWVDIKDTDDSTHADAWEINGTVSDITIRHSKVNWDGQQIFWGATGGNTYNNWFVYGNEFSAVSPGVSTVAMKNRDPAIFPIENLYAYNNTMFNLHHAFELGLGTADVRNNIIYSNTSASAFGDSVHNYNASDDDLGEANDQLLIADPFTDSAGGDFTLSGATTAGETLSSPYNVDLLGHTRGEDGTWDRGAYEYNPGAEDVVPSAFTFTDQTGVALGSTGNSDNATVAGIDNQATLALTGDASCKYSINGAAWATADDNVTLNDNVALQNVASGSYSTAISCTLNLGGVTDTWSRTTLAAVSDPVAPRFKGASMSGGWR